MFDSKTRYITKGINEVIPFSIQLLMWNEIDSRLRTAGIAVDCLQVFSLFKEGGRLKIIHIQEKPEYRKELFMNLMDELPLPIKIYVIDDGMYSTMLLAEEY